MHIQQRSAIRNVVEGSISPPSSVSIEQKPRQGWRRFMNERAIINRAYVPTSYEHAANCLTHGFLIVPSWIAAQRLLNRAKSPAQYWSSIIYGNALIFLFSFSTIFHCSCFHPTYSDSTVRHLLHRVDRTFIYIFISASYTPWFLLRSTQTISSSFTIALIWIMAIFGITYQTTYHERHKWLETCIYVIVGVFPGILTLDMNDHSGIFELAIGGLVFLVGIIFFKCDGIIPFAHAIWHCFVFLGAAIEYHAIYTYLLVPVYDYQFKTTKTV
ncbi:hypothetical protein I4U23_026499 [Adineta vaga]|nr:hypothetical protein I4U23_026499 [Adineta vaga]